MTDILSNLRNKVVAFWKSILWTIIMLVVFLLPANNLSNAPSAPFLSESVHIIMFAVLVWLLVREMATIIPGKDPGIKNYLLIVVWAFVFGIIIELLQQVSNMGRTAEIKDVLFDFIGVLLSIGVLQLMSRIKTKKDL